MCADEADLTYQELVVPVRAGWAKEVSAPVAGVKEAWG